MVCEIALVESQFPKSRFGITIPLNDLDKVIVDKHIAFIKITQRYPIRKSIDKILMCKNSSGDSIKIRDLINCLVDNKYRHNPDEYRYLELFFLDEDGIVIPFFGS